MIYIGLTFIIFVQLLITATARIGAAKNTGFLVILAFATVAGLRGVVGTDTFIYYNIVYQILNAKLVVLEPGFIFIAELASLVTENQAVIVNLYSTLFFLSALIFMMRASRNEIIYLFAFFGPQYFINYSMNGIRIGLASIFFLLFFQSWMRQQKKLAILLGAIAFSFHYTILIAFGMFFFIRALLQSRWRVLSISLVLVILLLALVFLEEYLSLQIESYSNANIDSRFGGLSGIVKLFLFLPFAWSLPLPKHLVLIVIIISATFILLMFGVAQVSYAGLRVMDIAIWITPLLFLSLLPPSQSTGHNFTIGLALSGFVGSLAVLRNIFMSSGQALSPFVPYKFIWEASF